MNLIESVYKVSQWTPHAIAGKYLGNQIGEIIINKYNQSYKNEPTSPATVLKVPKFNTFSDIKDSVVDTGTGVLIGAVVVGLLLLKK